jgi:hypothetical protein
MRDYRDFKLRGLSASSDGRGIKIGAAASPGTLIHTSLGSAAANEWDALTLYAVNPSGSVRTVTLEWGGTAVDDQIVIGVPAGAGLTLLVEELVLHNGAELRAYADQSNGLILHGIVRRYEQNL